MKVNIFIEIPKGSSQKYEFDERSKKIILDRTLYSPVHFPFEYGFIEGTKGEDGDPLDAIIISTHPTFPGCTVKSKIIGRLNMKDEAGLDYKIIAVPDEKIDPRFRHINDIKDLSVHLKLEIKEFFEIYKRLEPDKWVKLTGFSPRKIAEETVKKATKKQISSLKN